MTNPTIAILLDILSLLVIFAIFVIIGYGIFGLANRKTDIDPYKQLLFVVVGGILGSLAFTVISPFVVPHVQSAQADLLAPDPEISIKYAEQIPDDYYRVYDIPKNDSGYVFYRVEITNPSNKRLQSFIVSLAFNGCIDDIGLDYLERPTSASLGVRDNLIIQPDLEGEEVRRCSRSFYIKNLPPHEVVSMYYLVDTTPEEEVVARASRAPSSNETVLLGYRYYWNFRGQLDAEGQNPQNETASKAAT